MNWDDGGVQFLEQPGDSKAKRGSTLVREQVGGPSGRYVNPRAVEISPLTSSILFGTESWGTFDSSAWDLLEAAGPKVLRPRKFQLNAFDSIASQVPLDSPATVDFTLQDRSVAGAEPAPKGSVLEGPDPGDS